MEAKKSVISEAQINAASQLQKKLEKFSESNKNVETYLNDSLNGVNRKVDSICRAIEAMKSEHFTKSEVVDLMKKIQAEVISSVDKNNAETRREIKDLTDQMDALMKAVYAGSVNSDKINERIDALGRKIDSINVDNSRSQSDITKYTQDIGKFAGEFINANRDRYSKLSEHSKALFKAIRDTAQNVVNTGNELQKEVTRIIRETAAQVSDQGRSHSRSAASDGIRFQKNSAGSSSAITDHSRRTGSAGSDPSAVTPVDPTSVWHLCEKNRLGRKNKYLRMISALEITLFAAFIFTSFVFINGNYSTLSLGSTKLLAILWLLSVDLLAFFCILLTLLLIFRVTATAALLLGSHIRREQIFNHTVLISVVFMLLGILVCLYVKNNFYMISRQVFTWKDIFLADNEDYIGNAVHVVFDYWRTY